MSIVFVDKNLMGWGYNKDKLVLFIPHSPRHDMPDEEYFKEVWRMFSGRFNTIKEFF